MDVRLSQALSVLVITLLAAQIGLYVWLAPRGFEFTDEAYYLLSYLHWRDMVGATSFYSAYFEIPFRLLDQSIAGIRILSLLLLLTSGAFFTWNSLVFWCRHDAIQIRPSLILVAVGSVTSLFYFGYLTTLRAPSYNLLVLCSMLVSTGALLRFVDLSLCTRHTRSFMVMYGVAVGICGLSKATSGVLLVVAHASFFLVANRDWRMARLAEISLLVLVGGCANFAILYWSQPAWLEMLRHGVADLGMEGSHGMSNLVTSLLRDARKLANELFPLFLFASIPLALSSRRISGIGRYASSTLVVAVIAGCIYRLMEWRLDSWLGLTGLTVLAISSLEVLSRDPLKLTGNDAVDYVFVAILFALPVVFSFGTNMPVLAHSQMAATFPMGAIIMQLVRLERRNLLNHAAQGFSLFLICLPTLVIQCRAATDVEYTYRQLAPLAEQRIPVRVGPADSKLLVDSQTRKSLDSIVQAAHSAGFVAGDSLLDFTGDGPGLVYALGGRPLGKAWMIGGYPGSEKMAEATVQHLSLQELRSTWLLSSDNNPRAISNWRRMLASRLGEDSHILAATVQIRAPYRWRSDAPDLVSVFLWKPRA